MIKLLRELLSVAGMIWNSCLGVRIVAACFDDVSDSTFVDSLGVAFGGITVSALDSASSFPVFAGTASSSKSCILS